MILSYSERGGLAVDDLWSSSSPSNKTGNSDDCAVMVLKNRAVYWEDHSCTSPEVSHHPVAPVCQADTEGGAQYSPV